MPGWECGIAGCGETFGAVEDLIAHQVEAHERCECEVCGTVVPEGFFAIQHAFDEHTRAEYVRAYDADSDDIRRRENVKDAVEDRVNVERLRTRLADGGRGANAGD
jgi:hypothetical protein